MKRQSAVQRLHPKEPNVSIHLQEMLPEPVENQQKPPVWRGSSSAFTSFNHTYIWERMTSESILSLKTITPQLIMKSPCDEYHVYLNS